MPALTLKAHYDGQRIVLDEPFELPANAALMVTVLPPSSDQEHDLWIHLAMQNLSEAYSDEEPEYSLEDIKQ